MLKTRILTIIVMSFASSLLHAQSVTFANANDAFIGRCFNPALNQVDTLNPNRLIVGIHTNGIQNSCIAGTGTYYLRNLVDIMTFDVVAPAGYYVSKIKYSMIATKTTSRTGVAANNNTLIVASNSLILPGSGTFQVDLSVSPEKLTSVPVSITTFLFGSTGTGSLGGAFSSLISPVIEAEILPLP